MASPSKNTNQKEKKKYKGNCKAFRVIRKRNKLVTSQQFLIWLHVALEIAAIPQSKRKRLKSIFAASTFGTIASTKIERYKLRWLLVIIHNFACLFLDFTLFWKGDNL